MSLGKRRERLSAGDTVYTGLIYLLSFFAACITAYPLLYVFSMSISAPESVVANTVVLLPQGFALQAYDIVFRNAEIWRSYYNTVWYTVVGTLFSTILTLMAAYPLSRKQFFLRRQLSFFFSVTMFLVGSLIPMYILINRLGLYNTRWALILPVGAAPYYIIVARTFLSAIPESLYESAKIDGATELTVLRKIFVPLSKPIIAVPTTAGTAAEVTINYVITDAEKNRKMVCVDPHDIPVVAIVDPDMMSSMPKGLTAATGMDALTHAIEGYITKGAWELSDMFHLKAIEIISRSLRGAVENTPEGREGMALGQYVAGMGFSNVGLGIVHSMAHPLGALYDTPHGVANAIILPTVMEYNAPATGEKYREIARAMGVKGVDEMSQEEYRKAAIDAVRQLSQDVGIPADLKEIVKPEDVAFLSQSAYDDACRPGNPRDTSVEEIAELYKSLL